MNELLTKEELGKIMYNGITDYLKTQGKLYVTPLGVFDTLKEIEILTGCFRTTLLRRFRNHNLPFLNWYCISGDMPLQPAETCEYTDILDDQLFAKGLWLDCIDNHQYGTPIKDDAIIKYFLYGEQYNLTYRDFKDGKMPHIIKR